jgi:hypothetical protein
MKAVLFAVGLAALGFAIGAFTTPVLQSGPGAVWDAFTAFDLYPDMLEQGWLTNPIIGAVIGAAAGAVLGRPRHT